MTFLIYYLICDRIFQAVDQDNDGYLSKGELTAFVVGMHIDGMSVAEDDVVQKLMKEFDTETLDGRLDRVEFSQGISKLLSLVRGDKVSHHNADTLKHIDSYDEVC